MSVTLFFVCFGLLHLANTKSLKMSNTITDIPLSMVNDSVDDMYSGCNETMSNKVQREYFPKEGKDKVFAIAWKNAKSCMDRSKKIRPKQDSALTDNHLRAICTYTAGGKYDFYKSFNDAVLKDANVYSSTFPYHAMHYWLTTAIQILANNNQTCHYTYRRTAARFTGKIGQKMRFGSFASTSFRNDLTKFGKQTCFYVKTCFGAYLKDYPTMKSFEQEVLVPPYEIFKITIKAKKSYKDLHDCETIYVLESNGDLSNLNCKVAFNK